MNTKKELEELSERCLEQLTKYKFNKGLEISDKFRKGKITALSYTIELIYHFFEKDKLLKKEFNDILSNQINDAQSLKDGDYKKALDETLNWISELSKNQK
mgnify:FL=1